MVTSQPARTGSPAWPFGWQTRWMEMHTRPHVCRRQDIAQGFADVGSSANSSRRMPRSSPCPQMKMCGAGPNSDSPESAATSRDGEVIGRKLTRAPNSSRTRRSVCAAHGLSVTMSLTVSGEGLA